MSDIANVICEVLRKYGHEYTAAASGDVIYIDSLLNGFPVHSSILIYLYSEYCDITIYGPDITVDRCVNVKYIDPDIFNKILTSIDKLKGKRKCTL